MTSQARQRKGRGSCAENGEAVSQDAASPPARVPVSRSGVGDLGAGPRRHISLSEMKLVPWLCCLAPALLLFSNYLSVITAAAFLPVTFDWIWALLTCATGCWVGNMCLSSAYGAWKLRQTTDVDWHARLCTLPKEARTGVKHFVLLPNYLENEKMLKETLDNLARSRLARSCIHVVLAMEAREGQSAREKAERIVAEKKHLFADIFATFHPQGLPGEIAGKSSNTQWAFREALRKYGASLNQQDLSKIFLTVADADTLLHPQYLSALTYQGLVMNREERSWTIWQPPVCLVRNLFSVPSVIRSTSHATLVFELSSISSQAIFPAFAYSSYSMTLALASHPEVDGWDADVIAEDHHMFCKCYFAALWELLHAKKASSEVDIVPQVKVQPVFLPAVSYLVESTDGYLASLKARFAQARRHMQGLVELGYVLLQWTRLNTSIGYFSIPFRTHLSIALIVIKMYMLHIIVTAQCVALISVALCRFLPRIGILLDYLMQVSLSSLGEDALAQLGEMSGHWTSMSGAQQAVFAGLSQISGIMLLYSITCAIVAGGVAEGTYYQKADSAVRAGSLPLEEQGLEEEDKLEVPSKLPVADPSDRLEMPGVLAGQRSWPCRAAFALYVIADNFLSGYPALAIFAVLPVILAGWSLLRRGTDFEYIVASKPS